MSFSLLSLCSSKAQKPTFSLVQADVTLPPARCADMCSNCHFWVFFFFLYFLFWRENDSNPPKSRIKLKNPPAQEQQLDKPWLRAPCVCTTCFLCCLCSHRLLYWLHYCNKIHIYASSRQSETSGNKSPAFVFNVPLHDFLD